MVMWLEQGLLILAVLLAIYGWFALWTWFVELFIGHAYRHNWLD